MSRSTADNVITTTADILSRLQDLSDAVPYVKAAFGIATTIFNMLEAMNANQGEYRRLSNRVTDMLEMLVDLTPITISTMSAPNNRASILDKFNTTLLKVETCLKKITKRSAFRRFFLSKSIANDLSDCRQDIDDVILKLQVYLSTKQYLREVEQDLGIPRIGWSNIQRLRRLSSGDTEEVNVHNAGGPRKAAMKVYTQKDMFQDDLKWYMDNKEPYLLQVFGYSEDPQRTKWAVLFHDPGVPAQAYIAEVCRRESPLEATLKILHMFVEHLESAQHVLKSGSGGCRFDTADVNYHPSHSNLVLADWSPSRAYPENSQPDVKTVVVWDSFVKLTTKTMTGDPLQPGHVYGEYGSNGAYASRAVKHLVHLLWNYRYQYKTSDVHGLLQQLIDAIRELRCIVQNSSDLTTVNPLLRALLQYQPFAASVCSMWDIYDDVDIEPGDIGYMYREKDTKKLTFRRITTLQELAEEELGVDRKVTAEIKRQKAPLHYLPGPGPWCSEEMSDGSTRYTLRLRDVDSSKVGVKLGTDRASLNTRFDYPWSTVLQLAERLEQYATEYNIHASDIMLIFNRGRAERYSNITFANHLQSTEDRCRVVEQVGVCDGILYYYDTPNVKDGQLEGYWSIHAEPGRPVWPPTPDEPGTSWGWEHFESDLGVNIEVSRKGTKMRMRYLHL